ncbi:hypothetical protein CR513_12543, partial [Mucuna pruriens]
MVLPYVGSGHPGPFSASCRTAQIPHNYQLVATISVEQIKRFYWEKIVCHFCLCIIIISDNGTQFTSRLVQLANKVVLRGLRRRLDKSKGRWLQELPQVLWSYHTILHSTTRERQPANDRLGQKNQRLVGGGRPMIPRTKSKDP